MDKLTWVNSQRSRIKVSEPFGVVSSLSPRIDAMMIYYEIVIRKVANQL